MPKFKRLTEIAQQWGGGTSVFFAYTHGSHDLSSSLLVPLLPLIRTSLGITYLQSGLLLSAYTITSGFSQLLGGWLGDRMGQRNVVVAGLAGVGITAIAVGLIPEYYPMIIILVIMGVFSGGYHPSAVPMLSSYYDAERRGKALGVHMVGGSVGFALGPILAGLIVDILEWRYAFIILGVPALVAAMLVFKNFLWRRKVIVSETIGRTYTDNQKNGESADRSIKVSQVLRPIIAILGLVILMQLVTGAAMSFIPVYLVEKHMVTATSAALLTGLLRGGGIAGSMIGGWSSDRWGRRGVIFLALLATGPILYLVTVLQFGAFFILTLLMFGLVFFIRQSAAQPFLIENTPPHLRATFFGIYFGLGVEGRTLTQPVVGYFMDTLGIIPVFYYIALTSVGLSLIVLFLILPRLKRGAKQDSLNVKINSGPANNH